MREDVREILVRDNETQFAVSALHHDRANNAEVLDHLQARMERLEGRVVR